MWRESPNAPRFFVALWVIGLYGVFLYLIWSEL